MFKIVFFRAACGREHLAAGRSLPSKNCKETTRRRAYCPRGCAVVPAGTLPVGLFHRIPLPEGENRRNQSHLQRRPIIPAQAPMTLHMGGLAGKSKDIMLRRNMMRATRCLRWPVRISTKEETCHLGTLHERRAERT